MPIVSIVITFAVSFAFGWAACAWVTANERADRIVEPRQAQTDTMLDLLP